MGFLDNVMVCRMSVDFIFLSVLALTAQVMLLTFAASRKQGFNRRWKIFLFIFLLLENPTLVSRFYVLDMYNIVT